METRGKMLLTLTTIAILSGFSAIGFFAVQRNANLSSSAQVVPPISTNTGTGGAPAGGGTPSSTTGGTGSTTKPSSPTGGIACTTDQDCLDYIVSRCPAGSTCPPAGVSFSCVAGFCVGAADDTGSPGIPGTTGAPTIPGSKTPQVPTKSCPTQKSGDFDCSGANDCADLKVFISELSGVSSSKNSDINVDGTVSLIDFELVRQANIAVWGSCSL